MSLSSLSVVILALNEERHIARCIESLRPFASKIFVVDAHSSDATRAIARSLGAEVHENTWVNYATQFNWGLDNLPIASQWVMRMDADEYVTPELARELQNLASLDESVTGLYVRRRVMFMGRWIRHGGYYPTWLLRVWRAGLGRCEHRWMDEHIRVQSGASRHLPFDIVDDNQNNLTWWTAKHNGYATREAIDLLNIRYGLFATDDLRTAPPTAQERIKRLLKERIYARLPLGMRALIYFLYRYVLRLGFLDGRRGAIFHFLQAFWYRFLVDAKIFELEQRAKRRGVDVKTVIESEYGVRLS